MEIGSNTVRELIREGLSENAIYELQHLANSINDESQKKQIQRYGDILSHNYNLTKWKFNMGALSNEDWTVFTSKIANTILDILDKIDHKHNSTSSVIQQKIISFSRIEILSELCCWNTRIKKINLEYPIYDFHEEMGTNSGTKIIDPIFNITILNEMTSPLIINHIGIIPISARDDIKGIPVSGKINTTEGYNLKIRNFNFGQDEILTLKDPIYMEENAPFRFTIRLVNYKEVAEKKGNDQVIKFIIGASNNRVESPLIKMGTY